MIKEKDDGSLRALMSNCDFEADALEVVNLLEVTTSSMTWKKIRPPM